MRLERITQLRLIAAEQEVEIRMALTCKSSARDHDADTLITAHRIDRDPRRLHSTILPVGTQAPTATTSRPL